MALFRSVRAVGFTLSGKRLFPLAAVALVLLGMGATASAQVDQAPVFSLQLSEPEGREPWTIGIRILFLLTVLSLAPALLTLLTSFTRVVIVLGLLRQAMGTLHSPPNQVVDRPCLVSDIVYHDAGVG